MLGAYVSYGFFNRLTATFGPVCVMDWLSKGRDGMGMVDHGGWISEGSGRPVMMRGF